MAYKQKSNGLPFKQLGSSPAKQTKFPNSPGAKKRELESIDLDAPGTPGTEGYEPPVRRSDLDKKGKAIWDELRKPIPN